MGFDGRADNDALYHQFGVVMENAYDLQILHTLRFGEHADRFVKGLQRCLNDCGLPANDVKHLGKQIFSPDLGGSYEVWERRPLAQVLIDYAVADVQPLLALKG